jgi:hypothetical protein
MYSSRCVSNRRPSVLQCTASTACQVRFIFMEGVQLRWHELDMMKLSVMAAAPQVRSWVSVYKSIHGTRQSASRNRAHSHHQYLRHPFNIIFPSKYIVTPLTIDLIAKRSGSEDYHSPPSVSRSWMLELNLHSPLHCYGEVLNYLNLKILTFGLPYQVGYQFKNLFAYIFTFL